MIIYTHRHYFAPYGSDLAYMVMSKAGCTSIKTALSKSRFAPSPIMADIHLDPTFRHFASFSHLVSSLPPFYKTFTLVRHPFKRFLSFYLNKIYTPTAVTNPPPIENKLSYYKQFGFYADMPIEKALHCLVKLEYDVLERHLLPQFSMITEEDELCIDYVGKLEDIKQEWELINTLLFIPTEPPSYKNKSENKNDICLTEEMKKLLFEYYKPDFLLFEYDSFLDSTLNESEIKSYQCFQFPINSEEITKFKTKLAAGHLAFQQRAEMYQKNPAQKEKDFILHQKKLNEYLHANTNQMTANINESINSLNKKISDLEHLLKSPRLLGKLYLKKLIKKCWIIKKLATKSCTQN